MASSARLEFALKRFSTALDQLEATSTRLRRADDEKRDLADTLAIMQDDRGRLANDLDTSLSRTRLLEEATREVASRLGRAGSALRRIMADAEATTATHRHREA